MREGIVNSRLRDLGSEEERVGKGKKKGCKNWAKALGTYFGEKEERGPRRGQDDERGGGGRGRTRLTKDNQFEAFEEGDVYLRTSSKRLGKVGFELG